MATGNPDQYIKKIGHTWYVSIRVPPSLAALVGNTHVRRSLKTTDRSEANKLKHAMVGEIKGQLDALRSGASSPLERPSFNFKDAAKMRAAMKETVAEGNTAGAEALEDMAVETAEQIERLHGTEKAQRWYKAATVTAATLTELQAQWLKASDYQESTNMGHRKALWDFLAFLKLPDVHAGEVTRALAIKYIDEDLTTQGYAYSTLRDRLASLSGFWGWLGSRGVVPRDANPWNGHKLSRKAHKGSTPPKRPYTDQELIKLLEGTPGVRKWPTYAYLPDLVVLGMFSAARIEELCSLTTADVEAVKEGYILHITKAKTPAGIRMIGITAPAPVAVLKRRIEAANAEGLLFHELTEGGADDKFSSSAVKAFGRYRRACGVPDGTDFHSLRRSAITMLERADVSERHIARYVGHKVGTLAGDVYSGGADKAQTLSTSMRLIYADAVLHAVPTFAAHFASKTL